VNRYTIIIAFSIKQSDDGNFHLFVLLLLYDSNKVMKKCGVDQAVITVVGYYFCDEPIPYRTTIPWKNVTLGQFKQHIAKKGNYRLVLCTVVCIYCMLHFCNAMLCKCGLCRHAVSVCDIRTFCQNE